MLDKPQTNRMTRQMSSNPDIAFLGFGEAAQAFLVGLRQGFPGLSALAYDIKCGDPALAPAKRAEMAALSVAEARQATDLGRAGMIFSVVTADQAGSAARAAAQGSLDGVLYLDCNSCAPETKRKNAGVIEAAGAAYVDCAVMAPVHPKLHQTPCLLSGPQAATAMRRMTELGMAATLADGPVGTASMRKMLRSVMIKGIEALTLECLVAARKAGVEAETLASLETSFPGFGWERRAAYNIERVTTHGLRRAAEMREVARTIDALGLPADMSNAIVAWQERVGALGLPSGEEALAPRADAILAALGRDEIERTGI
jgi:3-hydroxyisobutyrate dehydrogenase-like beta-hydroxyacid dehydrogenase